MTLTQLVEAIRSGASGPRVLVRADLNVPEENGAITDDARIRAAVPTLHSLLDVGANVIVCGHWGSNPVASRRLSLRPVRDRLSEVIGPVAFVPADGAAASAVETMAPGSVIMLENLRWDPAECSPDEASRWRLAEALAALADVYVADAFGCCHRPHTSVIDVPRRLPAYVGTALAGELRALELFRIPSPDGPLTIVLGGNKSADKIMMLERLLPMIGEVMVGGHVALCFFAAVGAVLPGESIDPHTVAVCRRILAASGPRLILPSDLVVTDGNDCRVVRVDGSGWASMENCWRVVDIGPATVDDFTERLSKAARVFWNGPMGVFEQSPFHRGTSGLFDAVQRVCGPTAIGGGDTVAAYHRFGTSQAVDHVSMGGGSALAYLAGVCLPGLDVLRGPAVRPSRLGDRR